MKTIYYYLLLIFGVAAFITVNIIGAAEVKNLNQSFIYITLAFVSMGVVILGLYLVYKQREERKIDADN